MADRSETRGNRKLALACAGLVVAMVGAAYAAVPLYDLFCRVTGYGGTTQRADAASDRIVDRYVTVEFDANTSGGLGWTFRPETRKVRVRLGETARIAYFARNDGSRTSVGTSTFNVTPPQAGAYFNKIECFCFTEQELAAGESIDMPVEFFVSPDAVDDPMMASVGTITLSYTFFPVDRPEPVARATTPDRDKDDDPAATRL